MSIYLLLPFPMLPARSIHFQHQVLMSLRRAIIFSDLEQVHGQLQFVASDRRIVVCLVHRQSFDSPETVIQVDCLVVPTFGS
jgi:hypothetical protein